jgi:hypothetical protein
MKKIIERLFGRKYYAVVVDYMGYASLSAELWLTKESAKSAAKKMQDGRSQYTLHVVSFRSRKEFLPEVINHNHVSYAKD